MNQMNLELTGLMRKDLSAEIDFMSNWLAYPDDDLVPMTDLSEAEAQIDGMLHDYDGNDFPDKLRNPIIMMLVFNHCVDDYYKRNNYVKWCEMHEPPARKYHKKLWECLKKSINDPESCFSIDIVKHLARSIDSNQTDYDPTMDAWCDYYLAR